MSAISFRAADDGQAVLPWRKARRGGRAGQAVDLGLAAFCLAMLWLMEQQSGEETIPYHLLFLMVTLVYGFRVWPLAPTVLVVLMVTIATGWVMYSHYRAGLIERPELAEIPLMPALLVAMIWHARRRAAAQDALMEMADRQQRMIEREHNFFRDTSHAIRTPVTIARGHLELVEAEVSTPQQREDVQVALSQLERMSLLSNRLLALVQLDAGEGLPIERFHLRVFLEQVGRNWAAEPSRDWVINCPEDAVLLADQSWLGLAVDALIENAVHFTAEGGRIELSGRVTPTHGAIRVSDDGPGIAPEDLDRVFDRFWHRLPPHGPMGSGLGLAIARATARACGGDVCAFNNAMGGATFELTLPRVPVHTQAAAPR